MIGRLLRASLRRRPRQLALILLAVGVAALTWSALASFSARGRSQLASDLRAFGPNLLVRPEPGGPQRIASAEIERVRATPGVLAAAPVAELAARVLPAPGGVAAIDFTPAGADTVIAATPDLLALHPTWRLDGRWPRAGEVAAGAAWRQAAPAESPEAGPPALRLVGRVRTGDRLESALFLPLGELDRLGGGSGPTTIEVRAAGARTGEVARAIESRVAGVEARPLARVEEADRRLGERVERLLLAIGGVTLLLALLSVAAATAALLGERRAEMGLFLALGATDRRLARIVAIELLAVTALAALGGELGGELVAARLAQRILGGGAAAAFTWSGALGALAAGLLVVSGALVVVVRRVARLDAAAVLRGD